MCAGINSIQPYLISLDFKQFFLVSVISWRLCSFMHQTKWLCVRNPNRTYAIRCHRINTDKIKSSSHNTLLREYFKANIWQQLIKYEVLCLFCVWCVIHRSVVCKAVARKARLWCLLPTVDSRCCCCSQATQKFGFCKNAILTLLYIQFWIFVQRIWK